MQFGLNFIPPGEGQFLVNLKNTLKLAGWKLVACGDAQGGFSAYNAAGVTDLFTGLGWFALKQPAISGGNPGAPGGREWLFTRVGSSPTIRYARYDTGGYSIGGSTSVPPTATHDVAVPNVVLGSGSAFTIRQHVMAQDVAPYAFTTVLWVNGGGVLNLPRIGLVFDFCAPAIAGDPEPYVWGTSASSPGGIYTFPAVAADTSGIGAINGFFTWYGAGTVNEQVQPVIGGIWAYSATHQASPNLVGVNLWNNRDEELPIFWTGNTERSGLRHPKGVGTLMRWAGAGRALGTTFNAKARIVVSDCTFDWDGGTDPFI